MKKTALALLLALLLPLPSVVAADDDRKRGSAEEKELADLMKVIEQETEVATKTRMNSDFVPGIVTVLEGDELEALGIRTVWEALSLVPGVEAVRGTFGDVSTVVRGLDFPFNSGNIQIRINSVPLSREDAGINGAVLLIPIEQVERIEFIRGPGSVIYGDFAFMGVVNVVTRSEGTRLFLSHESNATWTGGARLGWKSADDAKLPVKLSVNASQLKSEDPPLPQPQPNGDDDRSFVAASADVGDFGASLQYSDRDLKGPALPPPAPRIIGTDTSWAASGRWKHAFSSALRAQASVDYLNNDIAGSQADFKGHQTRGGLDLQWDLGKHSLLGAVDHRVTNIDRAVQRRPPPNPTLDVSNRDRSITGVTLQDRFDINERFSLTAGARYESYSDIGERFTPRVAFVWRASDQHILKAQYAEGYRPPTFFELYGVNNRVFDLDFEVNKTAEINYVYKAPGRVGRATLFHTKLDHMIFIAGPGPGGPTFGNVRETRSEGVELEWSEELGPRLKGAANVSYIDTDDTRSLPERHFANEVSAHWLGNVTLFWRPLHDSVAALRWNHVGKRPAGDGYDMIDLTLSRQNLFVQGLDFRLGLKNSFDDDINYFSSRPNTHPVPTRYPGRTVWMQVAWRR